VLFVRMKNQTLQLSIAGEFRNLRLGYRYNDLSSQASVSMHGVFGCYHEVNEGMSLMPHKNRYGATSPAHL
jgi:hypothetical protein